MSSKPPETTSARLAMAMDLRSTSITALSYSLGVSKSSVSEWLRGGRLTIQNAISVSLELNISLDWLTTGKGAMDLFGPVHPTMTEMHIIQHLRRSGDHAFDALYKLLSNMARPVLGDNPVEQILALDMLEQSRTAIAIISHTGFVMEVNEAYLDLLGEQRDTVNQVIGSHFTQWLPEEDAQRAAIHMKTNQIDGYCSNFNCRIQRKNPSNQPAANSYVDVIISYIFCSSPQSGHYQCLVYPVS